VGPVRPAWPWLAPVLALLGGALAGAVLAVAGLLALEGPAAGPGLAVGEPLVPAATPVALAESDRAANGIVVDVAGAVVRPGLHRLADGDRVGDAIAAAGGFAARADLDAASRSLNLAQSLADGAKVLVPALGADGGERSAAVRDGRIDLNQAGQTELESLPGVGPVTARKIMEARRERSFGSVRELRTRGLVGESVYADIEGLVRAG
jgi:competence protein ComEA